MSTISGIRLTATYHILGNETLALARAQGICLEQSVEFPDELVPDGFIRDHVVGKVESIRPLSPQVHEALISYAQESVGTEFTQLLNVLFGNTSLQRGIRLVDFTLPGSMLSEYPGPRYGISGLRERLNIPLRPLLATALKPMGLSARELAALVQKLATGGIDIIKDDHGLADQSFAPFKERVEMCAEAVARSNQLTGGKCIYVPNITCSSEVFHEKALFAKQNGCGGLLYAPGLAGYDRMRALSSDTSIGLPVFMHPALLGSFVVDPDGGISHSLVFGKLGRYAGADATIYPNFGGRFAFTKDECREIVDGCISKIGTIKPIFPMPGGGMNIGRINELKEFYGNDVILLVGGGLFTHGPDVADNCRYFRSLVE